MPHFRQGIKNIPEICKLHGVKKVIIAPGSRNAPLIFAFTAESMLDCISITDERSAAYFALGIAQCTNEPVALVCTSGTAVLNFAPAVAEAYYQNLPLLVFTADRPAEMIDQADGQTLRQQNIFGNYVKSAFELPVETVKDEDLLFFNRQLSQAIDVATNYPAGPVQINVPLKEPIYCEIPTEHSHPKIIKSLRTVTKLSSESINILQNDWNTHRRKMIVFGVFPKNEELNNLANTLAANPDVIVVAENLSNISGQNIITQPESLFSRVNSLEPNDDFVPDLLITIGHSVICKQLKLFLRNKEITNQWQIASSLPYVDTYNSLTRVISGSATDVFGTLDLNSAGSHYAELYSIEMNIISKCHQEFISSEHNLSDMKITEQLLEFIPENSVLQLANSTSVRWTQLFPARPDLTYVCNRGTSGIDGSLSTAVGYATSTNKLTVFLTGDLSFIYDSNGLWNNLLPPNLKIIVMNNNGGNIFRFIGDKELMKDSLDYFTTPHRVNIEMLSRAYGVDYLQCTSSENLSDTLTELFNTANTSILEIKTNSEVNTLNYKGYFKNIKK